MTGRSIRELRAEAAELEKRIAELPVGYISTKKIDGKVRHYHQWYSEGKVVSKYLREPEVQPLAERIELARGCKARLAEVREEIKRLKALEDNGGYCNLVRTGLELQQWAWGVEGWRRRDCYRLLDAYLHGKDERVCILYGLCRTGKTTMIRQAIMDMDDGEARRTAYIRVLDNRTMADLSDDIRALRDEGMDILFIDEVTLARDFITLSALLSDIYVPSGMRIVLSGTDSLSFWYAEDDALLGRASMIHTTYIPFREHARLLEDPRIDDYIRYGGTLSIGQYFLEENRSEGGEQEFGDPGMARRYTNRAIAGNIQNSLRLESKGIRFDSLRELYRVDELTDVINRVVEDITHRFIIDVVYSEYSSDNLEDAANNLRNAGVDLYGVVNREALLEALRRQLSILEPGERSTEITEDHLAWLRTYLEAMDVISEYQVDDAMTGKVGRGILITQPGLRYAQVEAVTELVERDQEFRSQVQSMRVRILDVLRNTVVGRMMEEIVLYDTMRALGRRFEVFRVVLTKGDVDMVIHDRTSGRCLMFEVKHSLGRSVRQIRHLLSEEAERYVEGMYGDVAGRFVLYRGEDAEEFGVRYLNVEAYLRGLPESISLLFSPSVPSDVPPGPGISR